MNLAAAETVACFVCKREFVAGNIDADELERRIAVLIGLHGQDARREALATASYLEIAEFGGVVPQFVVTGWTWPGDR